MNKVKQTCRTSRYEAPAMECLNFDNSIETILCESDGVISDYNYSEENLW